MNPDKRRTLVSLALVAPLALFLVVFFVAPLWTMMAAAVSDPIAARALPQTAAVISGWDGAAAPSPQIQNIDDDQLFGDLVRRLNSAKSGFRTLMSKTRNALRDDPALSDFAAIDRRWEDPSFWQAIKIAAGSTVTDRNLLAAVDLERSPSGEIQAMPEGSSANRMTLVRTFVVSLLVTLSSACLTP
jgi:putative spermidine/putrescine transport system permease protein